MNENFTIGLIIFVTFVIGVVVLYFIFRKKINAARHYPEVATNNKEFISPKPAKYDYVFSNGIKCFQEELSYNQDKRIASLIAALDIKDLSELTIEKVIDLFVNKNILEDFLHIIFHVNYLPANANFSQLRNSELEKVFADFFFLNPSAKRVSQILNAVAVFTKQDSSTLKETEPKE